jgi:DNA-binding HxlR family transcriptional regulator
MGIISTVSILFILGGVNVTEINQNWGDPLEVVWKIIGGKWKVQIISNLLEGKKRFNEIRKTMPDITQKMLTNALRDLEKDGVVERKVYPEVPARVEYTLTEMGKSLEVVVNNMNQWGKYYQNLFKNELYKR